MATLFVLKSFFFSVNLRNTVLTLDTVFFFFFFDVEERIRGDFFFLMFIYLAALGFSCGTQDLQSSLQDVGSSSLTQDQTWAHCIESAVLATGPPEKSRDSRLSFLFF